MKRSIADRIAAEPPLQALFKAARQRSLRKRQIVIEQGTKPDSLFLVLSGTLDITSASGDRELLLGFKYPGEFFGEMGMFPELAPLRSARISARSPCAVLEIGYDRFNELARLHCELWAEISRQLARDLHAVSRRLAQVPNQHVMDRVWSVLVDLASHEPCDDLRAGVEVRITRNDLGMLAGCSREVAGLALRDLSQAGKLELKGHAVRLRLSN